MEKQNAQTQNISTRIRQKLEEFQFSKFDQFKSLDNVIFLMGTSRAGKSTLSLMLQEISVQAKKMNDTSGPIILESTNELYRDIIGHGKKAKTKMPNIAEIAPLENNGNDNGTKYFVVDCPGLLDSQGFQDEFTNSYFIMKVFQIVKNARFLLCIPQHEIKGGNMEPLIKSLQGFLKYFKKDTRNLKQIINATSLVVTLTSWFSPDGTTVDEYLEDIKANLQNKGLNNHATLFADLVRSGRVHYIEQARTVAKQFSPSIGKQIKQRQAKHKFYQIKKEQDIDFQFDCQSNSSTAKQFDQMHATVSAQLQNCCKLLVQCFNETVQNNSKESENKKHNYIQKIRQFLASKDIYNSSNNLEGRKKKLEQIIKQVQFNEQQHDFAELIYLRNIYEAVSKFVNSTEVKSLVHAYLNSTLNYLYAKHDTKDIYNLAFLIKRNFEELSIIEKIKTNVPKQYISIHSACQIYSSFSLKQQQDKFIRTYKVKNLKNQSFLKSASDFLDTFKFKLIIEEIENKIVNKNNQKQIFNNQTNRKIQQIGDQIRQAKAEMNQIKNKIYVNNRQRGQLQAKATQLQNSLAAKPQNQAELTQIKARIQKNEKQKNQFMDKASNQTIKLQQKLKIQKEIENLKAQQFNFEQKINLQLQSLKNQKAKQQQVERTKQKILIDLKYQRAKIYQMNRMWKLAFQQYESCRQIIQEFNKGQNSGINYKVVNIKLYQSLGRICEEQLNSYGLAIQYFKTINHYLSIKRCYQKYRNFCSDKQLTNVFIQNANFLSEIGQHKAAQQLLWAACQQVQDNQTQQLQKIQRLKNEQVKLQQQKAKACELYLNRIKDKNYFRRPDQNLIFLLKKQMIWPD